MTRGDGAHVWRTIIAASAAATGSRGAATVEMAVGGLRMPAAPSPCASIEGIGRGRTPGCGRVRYRCTRPLVRRLERFASPAAHETRTRTRTHGKHPTCVALRHPPGERRGQARTARRLVYDRRGPRPAGHPASGRWRRSGRSRISPLGRRVAGEQREPVVRHGRVNSDRPTPEAATWAKRPIGTAFTRTIAEGPTNPSATAATPASSSHLATSAASRERSASRGPLTRRLPPGRPCPRARTSRRASRPRWTRARRPAYGRVAERTPPPSRDQLGDATRPARVERGRGLRVGDQHCRRNRRPGEPRVGEDDDHEPVTARIAAAIVSRWSRR